ncbi:MAG TPA: hypothetical protein PK636_04790, partial [bacterium]|nr:hypothetical protein [bacterium]
MNRLLFAVVLAGCWAASARAGTGVFRWGRDDGIDRGWLISVGGGMVSELEGEVTETVRPYYELIGR